MHIHITSNHFKILVTNYSTYIIQYVYMFMFFICKLLFLRYSQIYMVPKKSSRKGYIHCLKSDCRTPLLNCEAIVR